MYVCMLVGGFFYFSHLSLFRSQLPILSDPAPASPIEPSLLQAIGKLRVARAVDGLLFFKYYDQPAASARCSISINCRLN